MNKLHVSPPLSRAMKSFRDVIRMGEMRNVYKRDQLEDLDRDGRMILKWILQKHDENVVLDSCG
jgi:hypothetical protein